MSEKYNKIGIGYNMSRKGDPYLVERFYQHLNPKPGRLHLDIGCGTGNYTIALNERNVKFIGIDPSGEMLNVARLKTNQIEWKIGRAEDIPIVDNSIDAAICTLSIHHWKSLSIAFKELNRVLRQNSKIVIFTSTPKQMEGYWLNHYFGKMMMDSITQMPSFEIVQRDLVASGFKINLVEKYSIKPDLKDLFLYSGKHSPSLYFSSRVRKGISSFSSLANSEEIEKGLIQLAVDIQSGEINRVMESFQNNSGDYLFIVAGKV